MPASPGSFYSIFFIISGVGRFTVEICSDGYGEINELVAG